VENGGYRFLEIPDSKIGWLAQFFFVTTLDENRVTIRSARAIDIAPAIAYDITPFRINVQLNSGAENQTWSRLATIAWLTVTLTGVIANFNTIK
jgi:hypothetical protein